MDIKEFNKLGLKRIKRGLFNFNIRPNTLDEWVVDEVLVPSCYMKPLNINSNDIVLDIGMNIGSFTVQAMNKGAKVVSFEPEPQNYKVAKSNIEINKNLKQTYNVELHNKGVSDKNKTISLFLNNKKNRGNHSTTKFRGREEIKIDCIDINEILKTTKFTKAKIDCEGEEYKIIMAVKNWGDIKRIRLEWHRRILKDESNILFNNLINKLENDGFKVIAKREGKGWTQMITAIK